MTAQGTYDSPSGHWGVGDATSTGSQSYSGRFGAWYTNQDILRIVGSVIRSLSQVKNKSIVDQVWEMLSIFVEILLQLKVSGYEVRNLPPLNGTLLDDGSFLLEWLSRNYRVAFVVEKDRKDSIWYLVSKSEMSDENKSGNLEGADKQALMSQFIAFVASNS